MRINTLIILFTFQFISFGQNIEGPIISPGSEIVREEERRMARGEVYSASRLRNNTVKRVIPKELKEKLEVTKSDNNNYLKGLKVNLLKLWNNQCVNLGKVVDVEKDRDCLALAGYEIGSVYSFENKDFLQQNDLGILARRPYPNAGIALSKERFRSANINSPPQIFLTQIMTDLGEISLAAIEKDTLDVKNLSSIQLFDKTANPIWKENQNNYELKYSDDLPALINHTYLLRSVFVDNKSSSNPRLKETIYAFQLIKIENNIAVILWKKVDSKWV